MAYVMGIDVGTTGTRAIVVNEAGDVVGAASGNHTPMAMPQPGWAEQDPEDWWQATCRAVPAALKDARLKSSDISAVGLSGQMHGVVLLDRQCRLLRSSLIWCDQRSQPQCDWITAKLGKQRLIQLTSNPALTGFTAPKLLWVRDHQPEIFAKTAHLLLPKDYIRFRLTNEFATEVSDASGTLLLDVRSRQWSGQVCSALGIDEAILPRVYESVVISGTISPKAAELTGLRQGTPVVGGGGDQASSALGNGIVSTGLTSITVGTSGVLFAYTDNPCIDPEGRIHTFCHAVPNKWHVMGVTQGAGLSLRWFRDQLAAPEVEQAAREGRQAYELIIQQAENVPVGSEGLLWFPYLMGERTPHLDANARGGWFGLTAAHTKAHLIRAILEGVAFSLRDSLEIFHKLAIPVTQVRLSGGGSQNPFWRQIQADIYRQELVTLGTSEGSAYGAALLAAGGTGIFSSVEEACGQSIRVREKVTPRPAAMALYDRYYQVYRSFYPTVKAHSHQLAELGVQRN